MLVGIQWSGKWTQARKIVEKFWYTLFDAGAELRKEAKTGSELGKKIHALISNWLRVPPEYLRDTIENFISLQSGPILFDGPIRSIEQDRVIRPILGEVIIIQLVLDTETAMKRMLGRRVDIETGETFPEDFPGNTNPKTGNILTVRDDDTLEAIKTRIQWSIEEWLPLIDSWEKAWYHVEKIDADRSIDEVFSDISRIIVS